MGKSAAVVTSALGDGAALPDGQGLLVAAASSPANTTAVVVGTVPVRDSSSFSDAAAAVSELLPAGLHVVGSYSSDSTAPWQPSSSTLPVVVINATSTGAAGGATWSVNGQQQSGGLVAATNATVTTDAADGGLQVAPGFVPVRAHVEVLLQVVFTPTSNSSSTANGTAANGTTPGNSAKQQDGVPPAAAIKAALQQLDSQLFSNLQQLVFMRDQLPTTQQPNSAKQQAQPQTLVLVTASSTAATVQELVDGSSSNNSDPCVSLKPLQHTSSSSSSRATPPAAPMFEFTPSSDSTKQQQLLSLPLSLDVLCYAPSSSSLSALHTALLVPGLQQQLRAIEAQLLQQAAAGRALSPIKALHFKPPVLGFPVTVCYAAPAAGPQEAAEAQLLPKRQQLQQLLGLPGNVPMLRFANALVWGAAAAAGGGEGGVDAAVKGVRLRNVHEALTPPGFGGQVYLVDGVYDYYHYMQDKFNDAGWGCAYRSLQTIVSWFRLQHYTSKPVPSHRQIQEMLVAMGDKPPSFIGSSQWIGAIELGFILDHYLDVSHKVMTVNQGADIPSHARALAQHFATQGTPVMIGGGVLAYTLLGVAFNEETGEAAFLILDPHYTGGEDLKKIVAGSWVAWKQLGDNAAAGGPLFVKDAFYNFMCPQRPTTV